MHKRQASQEPEESPPQQKLRIDNAQSQAETAMDIQHAESMKRNDLTSNQGMSYEIITKLDHSLTTI
jgi:hypothetical protein